MKIEIGKTRPANLKEAWQGELDSNSHFDCAAAVPNVLALITTRKKNGLSNACFFSGVSFTGDAENYYAVLPSSGGPHTYANIKRDGEFCVNFISGKYYGHCEKTIANNGDNDDEIAAGGFTEKPCRMISAPRIEESIVSFECKLVSEHDINGNGKNIIYIGEVLYAFVEENSHLTEKICGFDGFMYNINSAADLLTGERMPYGAAFLTPFGI